MIKLDQKRTALTWHQGEVTAGHREALLHQRGLVVWFTGLSGSGKSTIAVAVEREFTKMGRLVYRLDGDNIRHGLNSDLGFSEADRNENIRRIAEVAALFRDAGVITLVAFISPFKEMRRYAREKVGPTNFIEVYVQADLDLCARRDPKGLYQKVNQGEIVNFTGISSLYEAPEHPELVIDTGVVSLEDATQRVITTIEAYLGVSKSHD